MQKVVSFQDLVGDRFYSFKRKAIRCSLKLFQKRFLDIVKYEIQFAILSEDGPEVDDVSMTVFTQDANLSHHSFPHVGIFVLPLLELFDGYDTPSILLLGLEDFAVCAFANHLQNTVFVHFLTCNYIKARTDCQSKLKF